MKSTKYVLKDNAITFPIHNEETFATTCPYCNVFVKLEPLNPLEKWGDDQCYGFFSCPHCQQIIAGLGKLKKGHKSPPKDLSVCYFVENLQIFPQPQFTHSFSKELCEISPDFVEIYSQSMECKIHGYDRLVGMGLRKAIEFLITDYITNFLHEQHKGDLKAKINQIGLSEEDAIFADVVRLAGNDETHVKRTTDFSIDDMLFCIEVLTQKLLTNIKSREYVNRKAQFGK